MPPRKSVTTTDGRPRAAANKRLADAPAVFDIAQYREVPHYVWRDVEWPDRDRPLRVQVQDLSIRQHRAIPAGKGVLLADQYPAIAPYVVAWDFEAVSLETGETVPVPPPAEAGWEVFELLPDAVAIGVMLWIYNPSYMRGIAAKKASTPSESTTDPPSGND